MKHSDSTPALSVSNLAKSYGDFQVIKGLDLQVEQEAIHGLVGLNGSGKTTTLECLLGLQQFNGGEIQILGYHPEQIYLSHGRIVAIFDTPSLNPNLTVRQCLKHASLLCQQTSRSYEEVESMLGIESYSNFKIKNLSLGNKRRASIAQALLGNPELVILDEPFNGLDAGGVDDVLNLISTFNAQHGTTFLLSSHQLPYLEQICSHVAILHHGQIQVNDSKSALLEQSASRVTIKTTRLDEARALLANNKDIEVLESADGDFLQLSLNQLDSADVNSLLVNAGIPVSELVPHRASLDSLFRQATSEGST